MMLHNGNNDKNWIIRRLMLYAAMQGNALCPNDYQQSA